MKNKDKIKLLQERIAELEARLDVAEANVEIIMSKKNEPSSPNLWNIPIIGPGTVPDTFPPQVCPVCKGEYKNMTGYVCNHSDCPTKVSF